MPASVIDPSTFEDEWFGQLSDREMLVWVGVFGRLRDDQGRFVENAALARARLFPYRDVPVSDIQEAFDRFVADGRLHRYTAHGQTILQIVTWWKHQKQQWAAPSKLPSPEGWIDRVRHRQNGSYTAVNWNSPGGFSCELQLSDSGEGSQLNGESGDVNPSPEGVHLSGDVHLNPSAEGVHPKGSEPEPEPEPKVKSTLSDSGESDGLRADFDEWWLAYGRVGDKARARDLYLWWRRHGEPRDKLLAAASRYITHCAATDCKVKHAGTFLAKPTRQRSAIWPEWAEGEPHGTMDARRASRLGDVITAGAKAFGLTGGDDGRPALPELGPGAPASGSPAGRGLSAGQLE